MGVRGLFYFMKKHKLGDEVKLSDIAEKYRKETGTTPVVLIDISSCSRFIYAGKSISIAAELKKFEVSCNYFLDQFYRLNIKVIIVADGLKPKLKLESWVRRNNDLLTKSNLVYRTSNLELHEEYAVGYIYGIVMKVFGSSEKCEFHRAIYEADDYIADYLKTHGCFAVLSNDSDFVLMEGYRYCLSIADFNLNEMRTFNFDRNKLAKLLKIDAKLLPLVGTLCQNHILDAADLAEFNRKFKINTTNRFLQVGKILKKEIVFEDLSSYESALEEYFRGSQRAKFRERLKSLCEYQHEELLLTDNADWNDILTLAATRHTRGDAEKRLLELLLERKFYCPVGIENAMTNPDDKLRNLRRNIYEFLFSECPDDVSVTEHLYALSNDKTSVEYCCREVTFTKRKHEGLLKLWSSDAPPDTQHQKFKIFCEVINQKLDPNALLGKVKEELIFPLLAAFYLGFDLQEFQTFEMDALLIQAILANELSVSQVAQIDVHLDLAALHLWGWFIKIIDLLELLNSICGNPFDRQKTCLVNYFEGLILHFVYREIKVGCEIEKHLTRERYKTFKDLKDVLAEMKTSCGF